MNTAKGIPTNTKLEVFAANLFKAFGGPIEGFGDYYLTGIGSKQYNIVKQKYKLIAT